MRKVQSFKFKVKTWIYCNIHFSERADWCPTGKHSVRLCRHLHRHPPTGLHQRWYYACLFGGIGIGVFAGINPILSAMVFAILSAFGVQWVSRKKDVRKDSAIAMFWTLGMSVGIICCFLTPGFMPDLPSFLFGSILAIDSTDLWLLAGLTLFVALLFIFLLRPIRPSHSTAPLPNRNICRLLR